MMDNTMIYDSFPKYDCTCIFYFVHNCMMTIVDNERMAFIENAIKERILYQQRLRCTEDNPVFVSILDWISALNHNMTRKVAQRVLDKSIELKNIVKYVHFKGQGQRKTPCLPANGIFIMESLLPKLKSAFKKYEKGVSDALSKRENGKREFITASGRVDIVTKTEVIEVKRWKQWKGAIGQALVYALDLAKKPRVHLHVPLDESATFEIQQSHIESCCAALNVRMTIEYI
jgi:hypothetical protein